MDDRHKVKIIKCILADGNSKESSSWTGLNQPTHYYVLETLTTKFNQFY